MKDKRRDSEDSQDAHQFYAKVFGLCGDYYYDHFLENEGAPFYFEFKAFGVVSSSSSSS